MSYSQLRTKRAMPDESSERSVGFREAAVAGCMAVAEVHMRSWRGSLNGTELVTLLSSRVMWHRSGANLETAQTVELKTRPEASMLLCAKLPRGNNRFPRRAFRMRNLLPAVVLTLAGAASAHAQRTPSPDTVPSAQNDPDPRSGNARLERLTRAELDKLYNEANGAHRADVPTFDAGIRITNHHSKPIKSVSWETLLTEPDTGALIRRYSVTSEVRIMPGKTKTVTKKLPIPSVKLVSAAPTAGRKVPNASADVKSSVTKVTYADGSTSDTP